MGSPVSVLAEVLRSPEARRAADADELALLVIETLRDAGFSGDSTPARCRSMAVGTGQVERFVRCTLNLRHAGDHSGQATATAQVTWTDEQAAGVLRERE